ncbi:MAG: PQQ-binding-like beta-propeller repeat protein, partial [Planctomycetota bacterium]
DAVGVVGTARRNLADFVDETLALARPAPRPAAGEGWTGLGGVSGPTPPETKAGIVLATRWVNPPLPEKDKSLDLVAQFAARGVRGDNGEAPAQPALRKGQVVLAKNALPPMVFPVVAGEAAVYRSDTHVTACDLLTGQNLWSLRLPLRRETKEPTDSGWVIMNRNQGDETAWADPGRHLMTLAEGMLFVRYDIPNSTSGPDTASGLAAISAGANSPAGKLLWEVGFRAKEGFLHELQFTSAPTVCQGRLYVLAYHGLKCYLVCLEAATGKLLWERWICDAPREGGRLDLPWARMRAAQPHAYQRSSPPAIAGGTVLALPNTGVLVALDAADGRLQWARRYDNPPETDDNPVYDQDAPTPARPAGPINPLLVLGDRVICLPTDRTRLLALDLQDGRELWAQTNSAPLAGRHLSAVDPERILLTAPGLEVRSADTGELCHKPLDLKDVYGRPALMGRFVLASGLGRLHRLDLGDYTHAALPLEDPRGLLGNLAVSGQTLLAANPAGLCAYFEYDDACRRLDDRIAKCSRDEAGPLLLQRANLAFHAKAFDKAAADLDAATAAATEQFDPALLDRIGLWNHRLAVARGNHAATPGEALDWFQKARQTAATNEDKAAAMLRLAKAYEKASAPAAAAALLQELSETFPGALIADVAIGPDAPAWAAPEADEPLAPAADHAATLIAQLNRRHGREVYAGFDREAAAALEKARSDQNPDAVLAVAQRWPLSLSNPAARYAAAELFCLQALKTPDRQEDSLRQAFAQLSDLAASDDPVTALRARLAIRVIRLRLAGPVTPPSLPDTLPTVVPDGTFSFLDAKASFRDAILALRAGKLPGKY